MESLSAFRDRAAPMSGRGRADAGRRVRLAECAFNNEGETARVSAPLGLTLACTVDAVIARGGRRLGRIHAPRVTRSHLLAFRLPARTRATLRRSKATVTVTLTPETTRGLARRVVRAFDVRR